MTSGAPQRKTLQRVKGKNTTELDEYIKIKRNSIAIILTNLKKKKTKKANSFGEGKPSKESLETKREQKHGGSTSTTTCPVDKKDNPFYCGFTRKQVVEFLKQSQEARNGVKHKHHFCNCEETSSSSGEYTSDSSEEDSDVEKDYARSKP